MAGKDRNILEISTLTAHLAWAQRAGTDQAELERIVHSLETNVLLRGYQRWREMCETH